MESKEWFEQVHGIVGYSLNGGGSMLLLLKPVCFVVSSSRYNTCVSGGTKKSKAQETVLISHMHMSYKNEIHMEWATLQGRGLGHGDKYQQTLLE